MSEGEQCKNDSDVLWYWETQKRR